MIVSNYIKDMEGGHNPYFNRWFSAMWTDYHKLSTKLVTILILIDGFLQLKKWAGIFLLMEVTILILIDGFLQ